MDADATPGPDAGQPEPTAVQPPETAAPAASRRGLFGKLASVAVGAVLVPLGIARAKAAEPRRKHRYGMVIDTRRCVGCKACVLACKQENKTPPGVNYCVVTQNTLGDRPDDRPVFTSKPCFHCEHPPCVDVCPVSATFKREQDGIVVVDYDRCIGCRYCQTACPYGARFFDFGENYDLATPTGSLAAQVPSPEYGQFRERKGDASPIGNVRKCTFCLHLQDASGNYDRAAGRWPACAKTCTGHAIHFGDFNDPESEVSRLIRERQTVRMKEELGTEPNVHYLI
jgi:molybdopterin-containing oxidoreductase family iron-sulfur binding subunit